MCVCVRVSVLAVKWTHLSFEDFLEALCRVAVLKAFPTAEEIAEVGMPDAPRYLRHLAVEHPLAYDRLLRERRSSWGKPSATTHEAVSKCVEHVLHILVVACQDGTPATGYTLAAVQVEKFIR